MTDSSIVPALERELTNLEQELREDPRHQKIQHIRALLDAYKGPTRRVHRANANGGVAPTRERRATSKVAVARDAVTSFLREQSKAHRSTILEMLIAKGIMGSEKDPMGSLAAYLSGWRDTMSHDGQGNWFLTEADPSETELRPATS